jgi:uncharacterized protein
MFFKALVLVVTLAPLTFSMGAFAQTSDPPPAAGQTDAGLALPQPASDTVTDLADVLDPVAEARIAGLLAATRAETGVQMVVVTLPDIAAHGGAGMRLDAYAKALFNNWGIGDPERNDGILMLVATEASEVRIALGSGYDAVYDGRAARVLSTAVLPAFREGQPAAGIEAGIASSRDRLIAPFLEGRPVTLTEGFEDDSAGIAPWLGGAGAIGAGVLLMIWRSARAKKLCPRCGEATLNRTREVIEPATMMASGSGIEHLSCSSCGHVDRKSFTVGRLQALGSSRSRDGNRSSSSGRSGRSGGFGGGRSSGGGASGKW